MVETKFCKHCGEKIDKECVVCPKCGKQVEDLQYNSMPNNIVINNSSSASSSASAAAFAGRYGRRLPWYLTWFWIIVLGFFTGGLYWIIGFILRVNWNSKN